MAFQGKYNIRSKIVIDDNGIEEVEKYKYLVDISTRKYLGCIILHL